MKNLFKQQIINVKKDYIIKTLKVNNYNNDIIMNNKENQIIINLVKEISDLLDNSKSKKYFWYQILENKFLYNINSNVYYREYNKLYPYKFIIQSLDFISKSYDEFSKFIDSEFYYSIITILNPITNKEKTFLIVSIEEIDNMNGIKDTLLTYTMIRKITNYKEVNDYSILNISNKKITIFEKRQFCYYYNTDKNNKSDVFFIPDDVPLNVFRNDYDVNILPDPELVNKVLKFLNDDKQNEMNLDDMEDTKLDSLLKFIKINPKFVQNFYIEYISYSNNYYQDKKDNILYTNIKLIKYSK